MERKMLAEFQREIASLIPFGFLPNEIWLTGSQCVVMDDGDGEERTVALPPCAESMPSMRLVVLLLDAAATCDGGDDGLAAREAAARLLITTPLPTAQVGGVR